jgi:hypothetical protein
MSLYEEGFSGGLPVVLIPVIDWVIENREDLWVDESITAF